MMRWVTAGVLAALSVWSRPGRTQDSAPPVQSGSESRALELAGGGGFLFATRSVCRTEGDLMGCSVPSFRGGYVSSHWRVTPVWSTGLLGAFLSSPETDTASYSLWQVFADTRVHPWGAQSIDPWAGILLGLSAATDRLEREPATGARTATAYAPTGGLHAGADIRLLPDFSLQLAARGLLSAYRDPRPLGEFKSRDYATSMWVSLNLGLMFHPSLGTSSRAQASR